MIFYFKNCCNRSVADFVGHRGTGCSFTEREWRHLNPPPADLSTDPRSDLPRVSLDCSLAAEINMAESELQKTNK